MDCVLPKNRKSNAYWHQLWKKVFGDCKKRRDYVQALMDLILLLPDHRSVEQTKVNDVNELFSNLNTVTTLAATKTTKFDRLKVAREIKAELLKLTTRKTNLDAYAPIDRSRRTRSRRSVSRIYNSIVHSRVQFVADSIQGGLAPTYSHFGSDADRSKVSSMFL
jgi:hypothetical protein